MSDIAISNERKKGHDIRVPADHTTEELHNGLEALQDKIAYKEKRKVTKAWLVVELLTSHPKMKAILKTLN